MNYSVRNPQILLENIFENTNITKDSPMLSTITKLQERDTCLAFAFFMLLIWLLTQNETFIFCSMGILLLGMLWPTGFRPLAFVWFGLSVCIGKIISKLLLSIVFILLVLPMATLRRLMGKDTLCLKRFGTRSNSYFVRREHTFVAQDLVNPY